MLNIVINGQFAARRVTGQERFAFEIISELDKYARKVNILGCPKMLPIFRI